MLTWTNDGSSNFGVRCFILFVVYLVMLELCEDRPSCSVHANPDTFAQDPCQGTSKYLEVNYKCRPENFDKLTVCEGDEMQLKCGKKGDRIAIFTAMFGRQQNGTAQCEPKRAGYINCQSSRTTSDVRGFCHGKKSCSLQANSSVFGDPCSNDVNKYLTVSYSCVPKKYLKPLNQKSRKLKKKKKRKKKKKKKRKKKKNKNKKKKKHDNRLLPDVLPPASSTEHTLETTLDRRYETFEQGKETHTDNSNWRHETSTEDLVLPPSTSTSTAQSTKVISSSSQSSPTSSSSLSSTILESSTSSSLNITTASSLAIQSNTTSTINTTMSFLKHLLQSTTLNDIKNHIQEIQTQSDEEQSSVSDSQTTSKPFNQTIPHNSTILTTLRQSYSTTVPDVINQNKIDSQDVTTSSNIVKEMYETTQELISTTSMENEILTKKTIITSENDKHIENVRTQKGDNKGNTLDAQNLTKDDISKEKLKIDESVTDSSSLDNIGLGRVKEREEKDSVSGEVTYQPVDRNKIDDKAKPGINSVDLNRNHKNSIDSNTVDETPVNSKDVPNNKVNSIAGNDVSKGKTKKRGGKNKGRELDPMLVTQRNLTVICRNFTNQSKDVPWGGKEPKDTKTIGFLKDWFSNIIFLEENEEKAWLYFSLGTCFGIIVLLVMVLVKVCINFKRNIRARLDVSEPTHRSANTNNHGMLDAPMLEHSDSIDQIEVVRFSPRGTLRSMRNTHNRDIVNYYG